MNDRKLVRIQEKGQVTIPTEIRKKLGLKQGDLVAVMETPDGVFITPSKCSQPKPWIALAISSRNKGSRLTSSLRQAGTSEQIFCKKPMASPNPPRSVFLDSSVLYAAVFSATGPARRLILKGIEGSVTLAISDLVLEETKRNLKTKAPLALPSFTILADLLSLGITNPTKAEVLKAAQIVHLKDAPIVAAAAKAKAEYLATHDVKHFLTHAQAIEQAYGITVLTPAALLRILTN
jgi:AbrB family looped-hinge helix DNA binding protein